MLFPFHARVDGVLQPSPWSVELVFARVTDGEKPRSHGSSVSYLEIKLGESPTRRRRAHPSVL